MEHLGHRTVRRVRARRLKRSLLLLALAAGALAMAPSGAAAAANECIETDVISPTKSEWTCTSQEITVAPYEVKQEISFAPRTDENGDRIQGSITDMTVDVVNAPHVGAPKVPIRELMLHHIVFANLAKTDATCPGGFTDFAGRGAYAGIAPDRFYAAGEERAEMHLPPGYGYDVTSGQNFFAMVWMFMNHRAVVDSAWVQYTMTVDSDPTIEDVRPYWLDVRNCKADPIYNVPGTAKKRGAKHVAVADYDFGKDVRIVGGAGHVHGGAYKLSITQPSCGNRVLADSNPTWGFKNHPFYTVKPILHEPGPINMTGFGSPSGIPVNDGPGTDIRLRSIYDNTRPHGRVMGIYVIFVDETPEGPITGCQAVPGDRTYDTPPAGRRGAPPPFRIPLTGLNAQGQAIKISGPPGKFKRLKSGATVTVDSNFFSQGNIRVKRGAKLRYKFNSVNAPGNYANLHNLTLASGPLAIGSPNLDGGRVFTQSFGRVGTYRFFCGLHPTQMQQRVVVEKRKKGKRGKKRKR